MRGLRFLGGALLALALIIFARFELPLLLAGAAPASRSVADIWSELAPDSLASALNFLKEASPSQAWTQGFQTVIDAPAWPALGLSGLVCVLAGARRRRRAARPVTAEPEASELRRPRNSHGLQRPELAAALASCRGAFVGVALFSGMSNVLMLTAPFYMLEIYDRVLPSRSLPTLVGLSILAAMLFAAQALLDMIRSRLLVRIGSSLDEAMSGRIHDLIVRLPLKAGKKIDAMQPARDLESIRSFLSGLGPTALFDLPWLPLYIGVIYLIHPLLGLTALVGAIILVLLTLAIEISTRAPTRAAMEDATTRNRLAEASRRNSEVLIAMGMSEPLRRRWTDVSSSYLIGQQQVSDIAGGLGALSRALRMLLQSGMLGLGAYLAIRQEASAGVIIAASILSGRALAPVDLAIGNWRGFVVARQGWQRLGQLLSLVPETSAPMALPPPKSTIAVENVTIAPPGTSVVVVQGATFTLSHGQALGIIGPSGSGKSSLVRALVGAWPPAQGKIRIDGATLDQWSPEDLGPHIGYLPQDVELFPGTVAENISRFERNATAEAIIAASRAAGVHDLIVNLPQGYATELADHGGGLSGGQQQRIALARALYGDPFLVVLDEPNSNLDAEGEAALMQAIQRVRSRGGIVVLIAHRPNTLSGVDMLLVMSQGRVQAFGPRDEVLLKMQRAAPAQPALKIVPEPARQN